MIRLGNISQNEFYLTQIICGKVINCNTSRTYLQSNILGTLLIARKHSTAKPKSRVICKLHNLIVCAEFHYGHDWSKCLYATATKLAQMHNFES